MIKFELNKKHFNVPRETLNSKSPNLTKKNSKFIQNNN